MRVLKLHESMSERSAPPTGGAMDRVIVRSRLTTPVKVALGAGALLVAALLFYLLAPSANSQTVAADRVTISTIQKGTFEDFLPLRARVTPLVSVYLDAVEGGRVERKLLEDGAMVRQGQLIAVLSNSDLQLNLLARQSDVSREMNSMRSQELALAQTNIQDERAVIEAELAADKARRQYELQKPLAAKGFVPARTLNDSRDDYLAATRRAEILRRAQAVNRRLQSSQLAQLRESNSSLSSSLDIARQTLDALNVRAPASGQLTAFSIQVGQSVARGERLGQIDTAGNKLMAQVDEFYLGRVAPGQTATAEWNGKTYRMKVAKIYPQVNNGSFEVDFHFVGAAPADLQRGQTLPIRLVLSDPAEALLVPAGAFYNETGGNWIFVVAPDGSEAVKRQVRLGRRNADHIEVLDGLEPGERVLTSPYTGFADRDRLELEGQ